MNRLCRIGLPGVVTAALCGCAFENQFRNVPEERPSASLTSHETTVFSINSQPVSFWSKGRFSIPPGKTTLRLVAPSEPYEYEPLIFTAVEHLRYQLKESDDRSSVALLNVTYDGGPITVTTVKRLQK
ncbi:MAG: hypothetical protein KF712_06825 [Akkermansiaceae bacterium]|nr:hypothetical protein [Akkermansiaceae bacterium]